MDLKKTAREIGLFEMAINLAEVSNSTDIIRKVGASMPLPDEDIKERVRQIAEWLLNFDKSKYMFLMPEIALVEEMARISNNHIEVIFTVPCDLEQEAKERLKNNLPKETTITVLEEPYFPQSFYPGNGMIVISGYLGGDRAMVFTDTYRMVEHYSGFLGKKVFIPYKEWDMAVRYDGWMEIGRQKLNAKWRSGQ